jgi:hypothetical protein
LPPVAAVLKQPARLCRPSRQASRAHPRGKPGFWTFESGCGRETGSPLEGSGFEPSVPLLRKALLGVANRRRRHERRSHLQVQARDGNACLEWFAIAFPFAEGPRVRIRLAPAKSLRTIGSAVWEPGTGQGPFPPPALPGFRGTTTVRRSQAHLRQQLGDALTQSSPVLNEPMRAQRLQRLPGRRVARMASEFRTPRKFSVAARRCAGRARWRPDTTQTPLPIRQPGFHRARDASSDAHRKSRRADSR